jgi:hemin uptake protein HemP
MSAEAPPERGAAVAPAWPLPPEAGVVDAQAERRRFDSRELFGPGHEVEIAHAGAIYRLRRTSLGKLILTK